MKVVDANKSAQVEVAPTKKIYLSESRKKKIILQLYYVEQ